MEFEGRVESNIFGILVASLFNREDKRFIESSFHQKLK